MQQIKVRRKLRLQNEPSVHRGSCLCGGVVFELVSEPKAVAHCHCRMCQKQHGAAFATYASLPATDFHYFSGQELLSTYNSSGNIHRKFCRVCGSNIEWRGSERYPGWISIAIATLDTPFNPKRIKSVHLESRVCWLDEK